MTSNFLRIFVLLAITARSLLAQDLFESSECRTKSGAAGVCQVANSCRWLLENLRKRTIKYSDIVRCGFDGDTEIICCAVPVATSTLAPTEAPTTTSTQSPVPRLNIRPSILACQKYAKFAPDNRIIGGIEADIEDYPHMAAIGRESDELGEAYDWFCGGTLISERFVVTAAHCVTYRDRKPTVVRLHDVNLAEDLEGDLTIRIAQIIIHPNYRSSQNYNDISLLRLTTDVELSQNTYPACLWTKADEAELLQDQRSTVSACGFGVRSVETRQSSKILLKIGLNVIDVNACNASYIEYGRIRVLPNYVVRSQLCAFDQDLKNDTCQGDSGGPLQKQVEANYYLIGVTSFGISCGSATPSVYTRVSHFIDWIERIVWP